MFLRCLRFGLTIAIVVSMTTHVDAGRRRFCHKRSCAQCSCSKKCETQPESGNSTKSIDGVPVEGPIPDMPPIED